MTRFSLKWLFISLAVVGVICTAVLNANASWFHGLFSLYFLALFYTAIRAATLGRAAAFSIGFSVAGWLLMVSLSLSMESVFSGFLMFGGEALGELIVPLPQQATPDDQERMRFAVEMLKGVACFFVAVIGGVTAEVLAARHAASLPDKDPGK